MGVAVLASIVGFIHYYYRHDFLVREMRRNQIPPVESYGDLNTYGNYVRTKHALRVYPEKLDAPALDRAADMAMVSVLLVLLSPMIGLVIYAII